MITTTVNPSYELYSKQWDKNKDASADLVHPKKEKYLPTNELPASALNSPENKALNEYIKHKFNNQVWPMSVFFNFTKPTIGAWIGLIMAKKPTIRFAENQELETSLDYLQHNADGSGNGLELVSRLGLEAAIETGGGGFLTVMPTAKMTVQTLKDGTIAPRIKTYDREQIPDWDVRYIDSAKVLTYLKLKEYESVSDGSTSQVVEKHIEYFLRDGVVTFKVTLDTPIKSEEDEKALNQETELIQNGKKATRIPFSWFGANDNNESPDPAPITPVANLNVLHYQLYSRHVQQCYDAGQGQYHIDLGSLDKISVLDGEGNPVSPLETLNPGGLKLGSLAPIVTANGGKVELIQLSTDSLLGEEPGKIEERAIKIGAQMITNDENQTATAARISFGASTSNLVTISSNVGAALKAEILQIAKLLNVSTDHIQFELNKKLVTEVLTAQDRTSLMQMVMQGVTPLRALYRILQRAGEIPDEWTYEDFKEHLEEDAGFLEMLGGGSPV